jgi:hypothetical protein
MRPTKMLSSSSGAERRLEDPGADSQPFALLPLDRRVSLCAPEDDVEYGDE